MVGVVLDGDHIDEIAKMLYFIEIVYSTFWQSNWIMMSKEFVEP